MTECIILSLTYSLHLHNNNETIVVNVQKLCAKFVSHTFYNSLTV